MSNSSKRKPAPNSEVHCNRADQSNLSQPSKRNFRALSVPHSYLMPALAHSRLLSILAEFINLAKSTCFSAGLMSSTGSVHQNWPEREQDQAARTRGRRNKTSPFF